MGEAEPPEGHGYAPVADELHRLPETLREQAHFLITARYAEARRALPAGTGLDHESPFAELNITGPGPQSDES